MNQGAASAIRRALADEIVTGRLAPGTRLEELDLAARFAVSRTPVREALRDLAAAGLVEARPRRGAAVASIDAEGISQLFEAVGHLEGLVARLAAQRMTALDRRRLVEIQAACKRAGRTRDRDAYARSNQDFHTWIARSARNAALADMVESTRLRLQPFRNAAFRAVGGQGDRIQSSIAEHESLVAAILDEDAEAAERAMRDHVATSAMRTIEFYWRARGPAARRGAA